MKVASYRLSLFYIARCARVTLTRTALLLRSVCGDPSFLAVTDSVGVFRLYKASNGAAWTLEASFQLQALPFSPDPTQSSLSYIYLQFVPFVPSPDIVSAIFCRVVQN